MKKNILYIIGFFTLAIGIIGFFNDPILGIFDVDLEHNLVHIVTGLLSLYFANRIEKERSTFGIVMTAVYGLVTIMGFAMPNTELLGMMAVNHADNILHLAFTLIFGYVGFYKEHAVKSTPKFKSEN